MVLAGEKVFDKKLPGEGEKASWEVNKHPKAAQGTEVCECGARFGRAGTSWSRTAWLHSLLIMDGRSCPTWRRSSPTWKSIFIKGREVGKWRISRAMRAHLWKWPRALLILLKWAGWPQLLCALVFRQHAGWEACKVHMSIAAKCSLPGIMFSVSWLCTSGFSWRKFFHLVIFRSLKSKSQTRCDLWPNKGLSRQFKNTLSRSWFIPSLCLCQ